MYMHEVFAFHLKSSPFWSRIAGMHEFCKFPRQEGRVALQHAAPVACGLVGTAHTGSSTLPLPPRQLDCRCGHALVPARRPLRSQLIDGLPRESAWPRSSASAQLKVLHDELHGARLDRADHHHRRLASPRTACLAPCCLVGAGLAAGPHLEGGQGAARHLLRPGNLDGWLFR